MELNAEDLNAADLNGAIAVAPAPTGFYYRYEVAAKTDFTSFVSFLPGASGGPQIVADVPAGTEIVVANRFAAAGPIRYFASGAWQDFAGNPASLPTVAQWNALDPADFVKPNGFVAAANYFQVILYLKTSDGAVSPSADLVQIGYTQGGVANVISVINLPTGVNVAGAAALSAGTYIFDLVNMYRIEDGATDVGIGGAATPIPKSITTQKVGAGTADKGFFRKIWVEVEAAIAATLMVTPIVDDVAATPVAVAIAAGINKYPAGVDNGAAATYIQAKLDWFEPSFVVREISFWVETAGETRSS